VLTAGGVPGVTGAGPVARDGGRGGGAELGSDAVGPGVTGPGWAPGGAAGAGASSGALCTGRVGAGAGGGATSGWGLRGEAGGVDPGPEAACSDALACSGLGWRGGGGGKVPAPNSCGDALGSVGSATGFSAAVCWAFVRSATSASVNRRIASLSGGSGRGGTVDRFGYGWSVFGGAGRSCAMRPPSRLCHQPTGLNDDCPDPHPGNTAMEGSVNNRTNRPILGP
jgi:hypothetical protein